MPNAIDMTGQRFGYLVAIKPVRSTRCGYIWLMGCDCGVEVECNAASLRHRTKRSPLSRQRCKECVRKMYQKIQRIKIESLGNHFMNTDTLYSPDAIETICDDVRAELAAEFGPPRDRIWPLNIDPTWKEFAPDRGAYDL